MKYFFRFCCWNAKYFLPFRNYFEIYVIKHPRYSMNSNKSCLVFSLFIHYGFTLRNDSTICSNPWSVNNLIQKTVNLFIFLYNANNLSKNYLIALIGPLILAMKADGPLSNDLVQRLQSPKMNWNSSMPQIFWPSDPFVVILNSSECLGIKFW